MHGEAAQAATRTGDVMTDKKNIRALPAPAEDPLADMRAILPDALEQSMMIARLMAKEYDVLVDEGVSSIAAATIVGNRWRSGS